MANETNDCVTMARAEVERLFGQCLLHLQAYERLTKAMLGQHRLVGSAAKLEKAMNLRAASFDRQTLGTLVGQMAGDVIVDHAAQGQDVMLDDLPEIDVRFWIGLHSGDFKTSAADLRDLVTLRNNLVHHFLEEHELDSSTGCEKARLALIEASQQIAKASNTLRTWAADLQDLRSRLANLLNTPDVVNAIIGKSS